MPAIVSQVQKKDQWVMKNKEKTRSKQAHPHPAMVPSSICVSVSQSDALWSAPNLGCGYTVWALLEGRGRLVSQYAEIGVFWSHASTRMEGSGSDACRHEDRHHPRPHHEIACGARKFQLIRFGMLPSSSVVPATCQVVFFGTGFDLSRACAGHVSQTNIITTIFKHVEKNFTFLRVPRKVSPRRSVSDIPGGVVRCTVCAQILPRSVSLKNDFKQRVSPSHTEPVARQEWRPQIATHHVPNTTRTHTNPHVLFSR